MSTAEGTSFGKYFLLKRIATGGMGEIFLAKLKGPVGFEKLLVIKRILQHHIENEEFLDMFFAEARIAAQLNHPNVVQIYEMGEFEDAFFIAMEYCHGKSLHDVIARARELKAPIPLHHVIEIVSGLCDGLSYAHNACGIAGDALNVIHRDINPHNLIISYGGTVKVIDFGIAKSEMSLHKTETGTIKGKFVYMSPEQSAAEKLDKRSDIFSVGICLYEALAFFNPFAKANVVLSLDAIQRKTPPPLAETSPALACFDPLLNRVLAKKRDDRYQDCLELKRDLERLLESGAVPRNEETLAQYMRQLFEEQIEQEQRMIVETDSANTSQIEAMRRGLKRDTSSRIKVQRRPESSSSQIAAHAAVVDVVDEGRSRLPFFLLLVAIVGFSAAAVYALAKMNRMRPQVETPAPLATVVPVASTPKPTPVSPPPTVLPTPTVTEPTPESNATPTPIPPPASTDKVDRQHGKKPPGKQPRTEPTHGAGKASPAAQPPPTTPAVATPQTPPPPVVPPPPDPSFGSLTLSTSPPVKITQGGVAIGQTIGRIRKPTGNLVFGSGSDPTNDPFEVNLQYRIQDGAITYSVASTPWAIVRGKGGIGLGKTPLANVQGDTTTVFELLNPKENLRLRITIRYTAP